MAQLFLILNKTNITKMKTITCITKYFIITLSVITLTECNSKDNSPIKNQTTMPDTTLIKQLGADEYGMKQYVLAFIKTGAKQELDSAKSAQLQTDHLKHLKQLMEDGKLLFMGPLLDGMENKDSIRGILMFNCSLEEAKSIAENDPAVKAGEFIIEVHPWFGTASLMKVPEIHKIIETKSFVDIK